MTDQKEFSGPDLTKGFAQDEISNGGKLLGHVGDEAVVVVRCHEAYFAVSAHCTHYGGPLFDGLVVGETIRCPWHHACFNLRTGEALHAPAFDALACWEVEQYEGRVFVRGKRNRPQSQLKRTPASEAPRQIVIVGGGAAGFAATEMLRREGYEDRITMLSQDDAPPIDRPNLSKDYLAGRAPEAWVPLRPDNFYSENEIDLRLHSDVAAVDAAARDVTLADGVQITYDRLLLAMGAEPVRPPIPGADQPHVRVLRSLTDCRDIIALASSARRVVVLGASFIGLEVAAALRARDLEVHVVAPEKRPMERILGPQMGDFIRTLHEEHGVIFHLGRTVVVIDGKRVTLSSGETLEADFVVVGVGVRPRITLAESARLAVDRGIVVNAWLETSAPNIFAAGDIARWPDPYSGESIRVEHWVVAERQGQTAALNMLGLREKFAAAPYFWSQHYDVPINYVGHAERWDEIIIDGDIERRDCLLRFNLKGRTLAVASIFRDVESLEAEVMRERGENF